MTARPKPENRRETGRRSDGTFAPGCTGNAGGRPKAIENIRALARRHSETAINTLVDIASHGKQESARVAAASALLDRGWGRPTQPLAGDDDMPGIGVTVEDKAAEIERRRARARAIIDAAFGRETPANDPAG